jgi:isoquinoline 1-oxidoreductase
MLYGKVLRAPAYGAKLKSTSIRSRRRLKDVVVVQDGSFVGVAAPTAYAASQALDALAKTAVWEPAPPHPSSKELYDHLRKRAGAASRIPSPTMSEGRESLKQTYHIPYVQRA